MSWAERLTRTEKEHLHKGFWCGKLKGTRHFGKLCLDGSILLKYIFNKYDVGRGLDCSGSGQGEVVGVGFCECGNEPSVSIKYGDFLD